MCFLKMIPRIIVIISSTIAAGFLGRFLGTGGTGNLILILSFGLVGYIFMYHRYYSFLRKLYGFRFIHLLLVFLILVLGSLIRIYVFSHVGLDWTIIPIVLSVGTGHGPLEQSSPATPSMESLSSSSWIESWLQEVGPSENPSSSFFADASTEFRNRVEPGTEITSQPFQGQHAAYDPLPLPERQACNEIKCKILALEPIQEELSEVERNFPGLTTRITPSRALDLVMKDIITSERGRNGIEAEATHSEIHCYKNWLSRVNRGTDPNFPTRPQSYINNIDIRGKIISFYREHSGL